LTFFIGRWQFAIRRGNWYRYLQMKLLDLNPGRQLLRCPRCNELIGALSQECRYCHRILNANEIRAGIERYERVQEEESARNDRRALWFSIWALLGSIALGVLWVAAKLGEHYLYTIFRPSSLLAIAVFLLLVFHALGKVSRGNDKAGKRARFR
jgi:hypothetical protein